MNDAQGRHTLVPPPFHKSLLWRGNLWAPEINLFWVFTPLNPLVHPNPLASQGLALQTPRVWVWRGARAISLLWKERLKKVLKPRNWTRHFVLHGIFYRKQWAKLMLQSWNPLASNFQPGEITFCKCILRNQTSVITSLLGTRGWAGSSPGCARVTGNVHKGTSSSPFP